MRPVGSLPSAPERRRRTYKREREREKREESSRVMKTNTGWNEWETLGRKEWGGTNGEERMGRNGVVVCDSNIYERNSRISEQLFECPSAKSVAS